MLGKAQVIADRQPQPSHRGGDHDRLRSRGKTVRLAVGLAIGQRDIKKVTLVVATQALTIRAVDQAGTAHPAGFGAGDRHAAADQGDAMTGRLIGQKGLNGAVAVRLALADDIAIPASHKGKILGQNHQPGALVAGAGDQPFGGSQVLRPIVIGDHLHRSHHPLRTAHRYPPPHPVRWV